jgi:phage/conjugal plasmid C-4 type zinc finger TraR family protein
MAGGWARDGAVNEQIDISTAEAVARVRQNAARRAAQGDSAEFCAECNEPIPEARRQALPGVKLCISCQTGHDRSHRPFGGMNRRASKDALLK